MSRTVVLYSKWDFDPITVFKVPFTSKQINLMGGCFNMVVPQSLELVNTRARDYTPATPNILPTVTIETQRLIYNGFEKTVFVTDNEELALRIKSSLLAGQRSDYYRDMEQSFIDGMTSLFR